MDVPKEIFVAESAFRDKLEIYFNHIFGDTFLHSHAIDHHRRVWDYARDLLSYPAISSRISDNSLPLKLLIGTYLHDTGMSVDPGERHGILSRGFCEKFLEENGMQARDYIDLLEAVENHDNKGYGTSGSGTLLFDLLTCADDLDAFGYTGIFRFTEIYLLRSEDYATLGNRVISNASGRFRNLESTFSYVPTLAARFLPRFEVIKGFFEKYNIQSRNYRFGTGDPTGYCGVVEIIGDMSRQKTDLEEVIDTSIENPDRVISWYFGELRKEIT